jgi:hypothetical protein
MRRADTLQQFDLRRAAHDVDERDIVLGTDLDEHLAEVRRRRCVDDRVMTLHPHGFGESKAGERIDEAGCPIDRIGAVGQRHCHLNGKAAIFSIHLAAKQCDGLAHQSLRLGRRPRLDDDAAPFVADRERIADPARHRAHAGRRNIGRDHRQVVAGAGARGAHVGTTEQQAEIGRIDRRGENLHQHLVRLGLGHRAAFEIDFELALRLGEREHRQIGFGQIGHRTSPLA